MKTRNNLDKHVQYSTAQHSTAQYSTVQYSTVQYSTAQYNTVHLQYSTVQYTYSAAQYSTVQYTYSTVQHSTDSTVQTVQYSTVQYSTEECVLQFFLITSRTDINSRRLQPVCVVSVWQLPNSLKPIFFPKLWIYFSDVILLMRVHTWVHPCCA